MGAGSCHYASLVPGHEASIGPDRLLGFAKTIRRDNGYLRIGIASFLLGTVHPCPVSWRVVVCKSL